MRILSFFRYQTLVALSALILFPCFANALLTAYLKIPDIPGESQRADHEDEIDIHQIVWKIESSSTDGRTRSRAEVGPIYLKKYVDASSPYLALSTMQGKHFPDIVLAVRKDSGEAHLDYLVITMENAVVVSYEMDSKGGPGGLIEETIGIVFENITYKYTVQEDDHSAGDEHEITYDIAAGA